jgi:hypothetical protein
MRDGSLAAGPPSEFRPQKESTMADDWRKCPWNVNKETLLAQYKDLGDWARRYSTVRMTVATFFVTVAFAILQFHWDKPDGLVAISAFLVISIGFTAFLLFSDATFKRMNDQLIIVEMFRNAVAPSTTETLTGAERPHPATEPESMFPTKSFIWEKSGLPLALGFLTLFGLVDVVWYCRGTTDAAVVKVPVTLEIKAKAP